MPEKETAKTAVSKSSEEILAAKLNDANVHLKNARTQLDAWRKCGEALWPFVRRFGICGASLQAINAVCELGQLIGAKDGPKQYDREEQYASGVLDKVEHELHINGFDDLVPSHKRSSFVEKMRTLLSK